ncbi:hypothetical protein [Caudoviricetes sp.]|nr:hypothetical protein [Caudoviricetes sp.]
MIERDEKGRIKKGQSLNPSGIDRRKAMMLRDLEALTPRAIARLGTLIDSDQPAIALGAAKEVLNRNLGVPKARLDVTVEHSVSAMHMAALQALADKARNAEANIIDITPTQDVRTEPTLDLIAEAQHTFSANGSRDT